MGQGSKHHVKVKTPGPVFFNKFLSERQVIPHPVVVMVEANFPGGKIIDIIQIAIAQVSFTYECSRTYM